MSGRKQSTKQKTKLGSALVNKAKKPRTFTRNADTYVPEWEHAHAQPTKDDSDARFESILETNDLESFMLSAEMSQRNFEGEKSYKVILTADSFIVPERPSNDVIEEQQKHWNDLTIPRRPVWNPEMTIPELEALEREAIVEWRRKLAKLEDNEKLLLTPYEKNPNVWKQLWRVIERSQLIVQILDARDPLLFRSVDLEKYVSEFEQKKVSVLLLNKADLLSPEQRLIWAKHFKEHKIRAIFFSANTEQEKIDEVNKQRKLAEMEALYKATQARELENFLVLDSDDEEDSEEEDEETHVNSEEKTEPTELPEEKSVDNQSELQSELSEISRPTIGEDFSNLPVVDIENVDDKILTREELFSYLFTVAKTELPEVEHVQVGMVGYPNVGKSSTINVLYRKKKVAVSATPGKTKHFQTLKINEQFMLCDCPGLVFPTFMSTTAEMICSGLLRIAEMREPFAPTSIVCRRIPRDSLSRYYGLELPPAEEVLTPQVFLTRYARARGFTAHQGKPDVFRAARIVLNDFVNGKLLFVRSPPEMEQAEYNQWTLPLEMEKERKIRSGIVVPKQISGDIMVEQQHLMVKSDAQMLDQEVINAVKLKHEKVNRRQERRRKKQGYDQSPHAQDGVRVEYDLGTKYKHELPRGVRLEKVKKTGK